LRISHEMLHAVRCRTASLVGSVRQVFCRCLAQAAAHGGTVVCPIPRWPPTTQSLGCAAAERLALPGPWSQRIRGEGPSGRRMNKGSKASAATAEAESRTPPAPRVRFDSVKPPSAAACATSSRSPTRRRQRFIWLVCPPAKRLSPVPSWRLPGALQRPSGDTVLIGVGDCNKERGHRTGQQRASHI